MKAVAGIALFLGGGLEILAIAILAADIIAGGFYGLLYGLVWLFTISVCAVPLLILARIVWRRADRPKSS